MTRVLTPCGHLWQALLPEGDPPARGYAASGDQGSGQGSKQGGSPIDDPCPDPLRGIYGERYYPIRVQSRGRPFGKGHLWPPGTASLARPRPSILWLFNECFGAATVRVVENTAMGTVPILKSGRGMGRSCSALPRAK